MALKFVPTTGTPTYTFLSARTIEKVDRFLENEAKGTQIVGAKTIPDFCAQLAKPRKIVLLVKAGSAVDDFIAALLPYLEKGDIIIDGGNSHFPDSIRRYKALTGQGFLFVGAGVSGGEEGARYGPSIMPGGSVEAWPFIKPIFQSIAAKTSDGEACCDWIGPSGSGHYVKMVHNGIEYGGVFFTWFHYSVCVTYFCFACRHANYLRGVFPNENLP